MTNQLTPNQVLPIPANATGNNPAGCYFDLLVRLAELDLQVSKRAVASGIPIELIFPRDAAFCPVPQIAAPTQEELDFPDPF